MVLTGYTVHTFLCNRQDDHENLEEAHTFLQLATDVIAIASDGVLEYQDYSSQGIEIVKTGIQMRIFSRQQDLQFNGGKVIDGLNLCLCKSTTDRKKSWQWWPIIISKTLENEKINKNMTPLLPGKR